MTVVVRSNSVTPTWNWFKETGGKTKNPDTKRGMTPLQVAIYNSRFRPDRGRPMIALLLSRGADRKAIAWDGTTMAELDENGLLTSTSDAGLQDSP